MDDRLRCEIGQHESGEHKHTVVGLYVEHFC